MNAKGRIPALQFAICETLACLRKISPYNRDGWASPVYEKESDPKRLLTYFIIPRRGISYEISELTAEYIEDIASQNGPREWWEKKLAKRKVAKVTINGWPKNTWVIIQFEPAGKGGWCPVMGDVIYDNLAVWNLEFSTDPDTNQISASCGSGFPAKGAEDFKFQP